MKLQDFYQLIDRSKTPDVSMRFALKVLVDKYPYFQAGIFTYLKCLFAADDKTFKSELERLTIFVSDKRALFYYIFNEQYEQFFNKKKQRKEIGADRTNILLNAFFETVDDSLLDKHLNSSTIGVGQVSSDYFTFLEMSQNEDASQSDLTASVKMKHQSIIDNFINNRVDFEGIKFDPGVEDLLTVDVEDNNAENMSEDLQDDLFFTETLASIYIKQQKYERAYEIIKRLSLNYPEKNIYFADQISFLEKLIINQKNKK